MSLTSTTEFGQPQPGLQSFFEELIGVLGPVSLLGQFVSVLVATAIVILR